MGPLTHKRNFPRVLMLCLTAALLLLACLSVPAYGDTLHQTAAVAEPYAEQDPGTAKGVTVDDFSAESTKKWMPSRNISVLGHKSQEGIPCLYATPARAADGDEYSVMRTFSEADALNLMAYDTLQVLVYIPGEAEDIHHVRIRMYSGVSGIIAEAELPAGSWQAVRVDIGAWDLRTNINMMEITAVDGGAGITGFAVGAVTADGAADLDVAETFLSFGLTADGGRARYRAEDGVYVLDAGSDGVLTLVADAVRGEYTGTSGVSAIRVVLDNAREGGYISLAVSDDFSSSSAFTISSTCALYSGENTYLLPYDSDIALRAYRLSFRGLHAEDPLDGVRLRSVTIETFAGQSAASGTAAVSACAFDEGMHTLTVSGTIPVSAAAEHIDGTLALYEIPVWSRAEEIVGITKPLAEMRMSTRFSFSVDMRGREAVAAMCRYQAVILTADGYLPLGPAVYPETVSATDFSSLSAVGLYGADRASVFASNASSVIVDVYVDRLLNDAGGRLCVRGGRQYYLDHAYIKELDTEIEFYRSAEVEVYLRLLCASDLSEDGYTFSCDGAGFFAFDVYSEEGAYMLCAVSGYLAERYDFAAGFILGERLDAAVYNGADLSDTAAYGALCADTMRLLYNSAVAYIPDVYVIAPIGQYGSETRDAAFLNASGVQGFCDPVLLTVSLSDSIGSGGDMPWGLMYLSDSVDQVIGHTKNIAAQLRSVGRSVPRDILLFWQPEATEDAALLARYGEGCRDAMEMGARTLFLSVAQQSDPASLCASLKRITVEGDTARLLCEYDAVVGGGNRESAGRYVLNDFSHSYSTQGWMAGSGCTRLVTQADGIGGEGRSLHAVFSAESGSLFDAVSGNMICAPASGRNLRHAPYVVYSLQVITELESADTAQLVFVFGSGDERAEYTAQIPVGVPVEIGCDLGDFPGAENISYLAVSVQCDSSASVDIYDVVCLSDQYSDDELARLYRAESADEQSGTGSSMELSAPQRMLAGTVLLGSIVLLALFGRRKKEGSAL